MNIRDAMAKAAPRETAGRRSAERFEYQINWALAELISKHSAGDDYVFIFEYLDDVVILEGVLDDDPPSGSIEFCQVKTKEGKFTLSQPLTRQKGKELKPSIIGKLFSHSADFDKAVLRLSIVSNAFCDILPEGADQVLFSDLTEQHKKKIEGKLSEELDHYDEFLLSRLRYKKSELGLKSQTVHLKGLVADLLADIFSDAPVRHIDVWLKSIQSEIRNKNNAAVPPNSTFDQIARKGSVLDRDAYEPVFAEYGARLEQYDESVATRSAD